MGGVLLHVIGNALNLELETETMVSWQKAYGTIKVGIVAAMK